MWKLSPAITKMPDLKVFLILRKAAAKDDLEILPMQQDVGQYAQTSVVFSQHQKVAHWHKLKEDDRNTSK
jgi:hypothetical protein